MRLQIVGDAAGSLRYLAELPVHVLVLLLAHGNDVGIRTDVAGGPAPSLGRPQIPDLRDERVAVLNDVLELSFEVHASHCDEIRIMKE